MSTLQIVECVCRRAQLIWLVVTVVSVAVVLALVSMAMAIVVALFAPTNRAAKRRLKVLHCLFQRDT